MKLYSQSSSHFLGSSVNLISFSLGLLIEVLINPLLLAEYSLLLALKAIYLYLIKKIHRPLRESSPLDLHFKH